MIQNLKYYIYMLFLDPESSAHQDPEQCSSGGLTTTVKTYAFKLGTH